MSNRQKDKCKFKTSRGNIFVDKDEAELEAAFKSSVHRDEIQAYLCPVCGKYHIGRSANLKKYNRWENGQWIPKTPEQLFKPILVNKKTQT